MHSNCDSLTRCITQGSRQEEARRERDYRRGIDRARRALAQGARLAGVRRAQLRSGHRALHAGDRQDAGNSILYSNRSACYAAALSFDKALNDAERAISLNPSWAKGWLRKGQALEGSMQLQRAFDCYREAASRDRADAVIQRAMTDLGSLMDEMNLSAREAAARENPEEDRFEGMISWLKSGLAEFPYLYLQYYDEDYRGVHALTKIATNRIVLQVPLSHITTSDVAKASEVGQKSSRAAAS